MARTVRDSKLQSREARRSIPVAKAPYWLSIAPGRSIGYRKGKKGGAWLAKIVTEDIRKEGKIGIADDVMDGNGRSILSFAQAQEKAREWFNEQERLADDEDEDSGPYTVRKAMDDYLENCAKGGGKKGQGKGVERDRKTADALILPELGEIEVIDLKTKRLRTWLHRTAEMPPRVRTKPGKPQQFRDTSDDPEAVRRRRSTANRVWNILRGCLNHAFEEKSFIETDAAWRRVKPFQNVDKPRARYLERDEAIRLIRGSDPDFRKLVKGALATGARYGELASMRTSDFSGTQKNIHIADSKSAKGRWIWLTDDGVKTFEELTAGKDRNDLIFTRADGGGWARSHQTRPMAKACKSASIDPPADFHCLRHTYCSHAVMAGMHLMVLAKNLGHRDTRMVERHYGHLADKWSAEQVRENAPQWGEHGNVETIRPVG